MTRVSFLQPLRCFSIQYACGSTCVVAERRRHVYLRRFVQKQTKYPICYFNMHRRRPPPEKPPVPFKYSIGGQQRGPKIGASPGYYLFIYRPTRHTHIDTHTYTGVDRNEFEIPIGEFRADFVRTDRLGHGQKENDNSARARWPV